MTKNKMKVITINTPPPFMLRRKTLIFIGCLITILFLYGYFFNDNFIWILIIANLLTLIILIYFYLSYKKSLSIKLRRFIQNNNLYNETTSAKLGYFSENNKLIIRFFKNADIFTDKADQFAKHFSAIVDLTITEISTTNTYIDYIFDTSLDGRLHFNERNVNDYKIRLSKKISWKIGTPPHVLMVGNTKSGKTYLATILILDYLKMGSDIKIVDPKNADLAIIGRRIDITKYGKVKNIATTQHDIAKIFREAHDEMNRRYDEWFSNDSLSFGKTWEDIPNAKPLVLIIDEFAAFSSVADPKIAKEVTNYLTSLILKGRMAGIEIFLIQQRADITTNGLSGSIRDQFGVRIGMKRLSKDAMKMLWGFDYTEIVSRQSTNNQIGMGHIVIDGQNIEPRYFEAPLLPNDKGDYLDYLDEAILQNITQ